MKKIYFLIVGLFMFLGVNAQVINFSDTYFKGKLLDANENNGIAKNSLAQYFKIDSNNNGEIEILEALEVVELNVNSTNINSLDGIEYFENIEILNCSYNNLSVINLSSLTNLRSLDCSHNQLTNLNLSGLFELEVLFCSNNQLASLNISGLTSLVDVSCNVNQLNTLILDSTLVNLVSLYVNYNNLTYLDLGNLPNLNSFSCYNNSLISLNINQCTNLLGFSCNHNQLTSLYLNDLVNLNSFQCSYNPNLSSIFIKNGKTYTFSNGINLLGSNIDYICVDDFNIQVFKDKLEAVGNFNCEVNSYCSFTLGGNYKIINGNCTFDNENNGCDVSDNFYPNLKLNIVSDFNSEIKTSDQNGNYFIPLYDGSYSITPIFENTNYFVSSPTGFQLNFPEQNSPYLQNFCISPNGIHNDLEVTILPLLPARPGFDASYRIIYKNKGTTTLSGSVTFQFEDNKMDLVSSTPLFSSQVTGLLTYNYTNLQPFETREINITMNINTPQENPAVNLGDQLNFAAIINPLSGDEHLPDNSSSLKQIVVGSYDPNDKTCVEGNEVGPESIGQYVHYVIRFENTGTFPAENIVVKDMIDLTKFDLSTLIPISSSHSFITRIAADGKVEFIFENIQLPFDDANNDGYVAFKIKTLPSLVVGNTFSNKANIYFDYNFPIETNTATTTILALGNPDFDLREYLTLYPNPAQNSLNIKSNNEISISSLNIYNSLGQLVLVATNPSENIDVSDLKTGSYFIKVISDKGISNCQFIKK